MRAVQKRALGLHKSRRNERSTLSATLRVAADAIAADGAISEAQLLNVAADEIELGEIESARGLIELAPALADRLSTVVRI